MTRATIAAFVLAAATGTIVGLPATASAASADAPAAPAEARHCTGKQSWPRLLGVDAERAAAVIERENPDVTAVVVPFGQPVTMDLRCDRVWVFVAHDTASGDDVVVRTPTVG